MKYFTMAWVVGSSLVLFFVLVHFDCIHWPVNIVHSDPNAEIVVKPDTVEYKDVKTKKKVKVRKALEANVVKLPDGTLKISRLGFVLIPKAGIVYGLDFGINYAGGIRFVYFDNFGMEALVNDHRGFLGIDYRLPVLNLLTISGGASAPFTDPSKASLYLGSSATLSL